MQESFQIRIDDRHVAQSVDGRQLRLRIPGTSRETWTSTLSDLSAILVAKGLIKPWEIQGHEATIELIRDRLDAAMKAHAANPRTPMTLRFGKGDFNLVWHPLTSNGGGGDWTLTNPGRTIARLNGGHDEVGHYGSPAKAILKVIERSLFARKESVAYSDLSRIVLTIADELTADVKIGGAR
ncbi:MAG: hypothetical protein JWM57_2557 [Phycisphaerales bacterium]|nr:hypothetical protein [Phycisphaerales bacterium]